MYACVYVRTLVYVTYLAEMAWNSKNGVLDFIPRSRPKPVTNETVENVATTVSGIASDLSLSMSVK